MSKFTHIKYRILKNSDGTYRVIAVGRANGRRMKFTMSAHFMSDVDARAWLNASGFVPYKPMLNRA